MITNDYSTINPDILSVILENCSLVEAIKLTRVNKHYFITINSLFKNYSSLIKNNSHNSYPLKLKGLQYFSKFSPEDQVWKHSVANLKSKIKELYLSSVDSSLIGKLFPVMDELIVPSELIPRTLKTKPYCQSLKAWTLFMQQATAQKQMSIFTIESIKSAHQLTRHLADPNNHHQSIILPYIQELKLNLTDLFNSNSPLDARTAVNKEKHQDIAAFIKQTFPHLKTLSLSLNDIYQPLVGMSRDTYLDLFIRMLFINLIPAETKIETLAITIYPSTENQELPLSEYLLRQLVSFLQKGFFAHLPSLKAISLTCKSSVQEEIKELFLDVSHSQVKLSEQTNDEMITLTFSLLNSEIKE